MPHQLARSPLASGLFNAISPQPLYSFATGCTHVSSQNLVNYFNPAFSWYESLFVPSDFQKTTAAWPIVLRVPLAQGRAHRSKRDRA